MQVQCPPNNRRGTTLVELLCAIALVAALAGITVARSRIQAKRHQARCVYHLKELGVAFRQFANDNGDRFPMAVSTALGGAREAARAGDLGGIFRSLSTYQRGAEHTVCPADQRKAAASMSLVHSGSVSYFINLSGTPLKPESVLVGDRHLRVTAKAGTGSSPLAGMHLLAGGKQKWSWSRELHGGTGNIALADGAVKRMEANAVVERLNGPVTSGLALFPN